VIIFDFVLFVVAALSAIGAANLWARRLYPDRPWSRVLATGVLAILAVVVLSEVVGSFGYLSRGPLTLGAVILFLVSRLTLRYPSRRSYVPIRWPLGTAATLVAVAFGAGLLAVSLGRPTQNLDTLQYHYPLVAHWLDVGNLTTPKVFAVGIDPWFYPSNGNLLELWSVAWFRADFMVSCVGWLTFGITAAAVVGVVRRLGGRLTTGLATALGFLTVPVVLGSQARSGQVDLLVAGLCAASVYFGLAWWQEQRPADALLAGAAAGLAAGTKYVALPYALAFAALFVVVVVVAARTRRLRRAPAYRAVLLFGVAAATGGAFFYLRNLLVAGNPLFPGPILGLPGAWMPANLDAINKTVLDYVVHLDPHPWIIGSWVVSTWVVGIAALASTVAVPLILLAKRSRLSDGKGQESLAPAEVAATGVAVASRASAGPSVAPTLRGTPGQLLVVGWIVPLLLLAGYVVAPTSAGGPMGYPAWFPPNIRYGFPFILLAFTGLVATVERVSPRATAWFLGAVLAANGAHMALTMVGVLPGGGATPTPTIVAGMAIGTLATAAAFGLALLARRWVLDDSGMLRLGREAMWTLLGALAAVAFAAGSMAAWHFATDDRFGFFPDEYDVGFRLVQDLERTHPEGVTFAFSNWPNAYPFWGSRLQNDVIVASDENTAGPGEDEPSPGVGKPLASAEALVDFVDSNHVGYFVAREAAPIQQDGGLDADTIERLAAELDVRPEVMHPREVAFARSRPDVFEVVAQSGPSWVFRVIPPGERS